MIRIITENCHLNNRYFLKKMQSMVKKLRVRGDINIKVGTNGESRRLNAEYFGDSRPTDVLSFAMKEQLPDGYHLGDIFVNYYLAQREAKKNTESLNEELLRLMTHGLLHLSGFDHEKDSGRMNALQENLVNECLKDNP